MQILGPFCDFIALILGQYSLKDHRVTKNVNENKFQEIWGKLESK